MRGLVFFALFVVSAAQAKPNFTPSEEQRLLDGKFVLNKLNPTGGAGVAFVAFSLVKLPVEQIWPVVRDCQYFKDFMPRTKTSELRERKGKTAICYVEVSMPFPFKNLWSTVRSVESHDQQGSYTRSWTLIDGTYERNTGRWTVSRWKGQKNTSLLTYEVDVNPNVALPSFIIQKAQTGTLPGLFDAVRDRARKQTMP
ncbi:MAG: SRPBCC family protein [Myxococcota bacterium]|nr:SRPBCC family protein [Myxococcota bacterium]